MEYELRLFWRKIFGFNWKFGLFLVLVICIPRFILVLNANASGNYGFIGLVMVISALAPFIFLTRHGQKVIGIKRPRKYPWLLIAFFLGFIFSVGLHYMGLAFYGSSYQNWYVYIGRSYKIPEGINQHDKAILFSIVALTGMTFSPIGEELFFRGIVHSTFAASIGDKKASFADGSAFALTHISHFGLVFIDDRWKLLTIPTLIWVTSMFLVSLLFFICRKYSGSIAGAIFSHAGFNLGMIYCIFYLL